LMWEVRPLVLLLLLSGTTALAAPGRPGRSARAGTTGRRACRPVTPPLTTSVSARDLTRVKGGAVDLTSIVNAGPATPLAKSAAWMGGINGLGFLISFLFKGCHYHLDLLGTGAFAVTAAVSHLAGPGTLFARQRLVAGIVGTWSVRLASFLLFRVIKTKHDARLEELLLTVPGMATFWFLSFLWGWLVISPQTMLSGSPVNVPLGNWGKAAAAVAFLGIVIEAAADFSKWSFKSNPANKGLFCNVGVWKWSQHPNYAGNLLIWYGVTALCLPPILNGATGLAFGGKLASALVGPAFLTLLFNGQARGFIADAVEAAEKRYGGVPGYKDYVANTPLIFPWGK